DSCAWREGHWLDLSLAGRRTTRDGGVRAPPGLGGRPRLAPPRLRDARPAALAGLLARGARGSAPHHAADDLRDRDGSLEAERPARPRDRARARFDRRGALRLAREERVDRRVGVARRAQLEPRAVARILVLAPADQLGPVPEAVALHLVVAHLDDELRQH